MGFPKAQWLTSSSLPAFRGAGHVTPQIFMLSICGLGVPNRAELSRQALVGSPGDRRHGAYQTTSSSDVAQIGRPKLCLGPMMRFIQNSYSLDPLPADAGSTSHMRMLAAEEKCG